MKRTILYPVIILFILTTHAKSCGVKTKSCGKKHVTTIKKDETKSTKLDQLFSYDNHFYKI